MKLKSILAGCQLLAAMAAPAVLAADRPASEHGRYLVMVGGCNDCHTPGFAENGGRTPQSDWLVGSPVGFSGPWGTTYPGNLRLLARTLTEQQWIALARAPMRPPMPSPSLDAMSDKDLGAMYRFIRGLGAKGEPAPAYVPPGGQVATPYIDFVPKNLPVQTSAVK